MPGNGIWFPVAGLFRMKRLKVFGLVILSALALSWAGCASAPESELALTLDDVYYEQHYYMGTTTGVLVVNLVLENRGTQEIGISRSYFQDASGIFYPTSIFPSRKLPEGECCKGIKRIVRLEANEKTDGYLMVYEPLSDDATGLEVTVETDEADTGPVVLALPDINLIRVFHFFDTAPYP